MEDERRGTVGWLIVAVIITVIWSLFLLSARIAEIGSEVEGGMVPEAAGHVLANAIIVCLVVFVVLYFLIVRRRAPERGPLYFLILFAFAVLAPAGVIELLHLATTREAAQYRVAVADLTQTFSGLTNRRTGADQLTLRAQGEAGDLERVLKKFAVTAADAARKYRDTLAALDYPAFMTPSRLAADPGLVGTRTKIKTARAALNAYRIQYDASLANLQTDIETVGSHDAWKEGALTAVTQGRANSRELFDCRDDIFVELEAMVDLLARREGHWKVDDQRILFTSRRDLEAYGTYQAKLQQRAQEERALVAQARSNVTEELNAIARAVN